MTLVTDRAWREHDEWLALNPPRPAHQPQHRRPRAPLADRLTDRGGYVVTVLVTLAVVALVCSAALIGGAR